MVISFAELADRIARPAYSPKVDGASTEDSRGTKPLSLRPNCG